MRYSVSCFDTVRRFVPTVDSRGGTIRWMLLGSSQKSLSIAQLNPTGGDVEANSMCSCVGRLIQDGENMHNLKEESIVGKDILTEVRRTQGGFHLLVKILGRFIFMAGYYSIFKFLFALLRFIPFIGTWMHTFGNIPSFIAALLFANFSWFLTIAICWLIVKPIRGMILLAVSGAMIGLPCGLSAMMAKK